MELTRDFQTVLKNSDLHEAIETDLLNPVDGQVKPIRVPMGFGRG